MKTKLSGIFAVGILMIALMTVQDALAAKPAPAATGGIYEDANFAAPDFANGDSASINTGITKTFSYSCKCSRSQACTGTIKLQEDSGSGFTTIASSPCSVAKGATCYASSDKTFLQTGQFSYRIFCDANPGTDFTQPVTEHVTISVSSPPAVCTENETRLCPLQQGVCSGAQQMCQNNTWTSCNYGTDYESPESTLTDGLDNDCDGMVDERENQLLLTGLTSAGSISILSYDSNSQQYNTAWSTTTAGIASVSGGGELGDVDGDGHNDFVIVRYDGTNFRLEVWTSINGTWSMARTENNVRYVGDIKDFDADGINEILVSRLGSVDIIKFTPSGLSTSASFTCAGHYPKAGGDLNNDGIPEILYSCPGSSALTIRQFNQNTGTYDVVANVTLPLSSSGVSAMTVDDCEAGDVNTDDIDDLILCGNSQEVHVLSYVNGQYVFIFNSSMNAPGGSNYTQTCSIGSRNADGSKYFFSVDKVMHFFTWDGNSFVNTWNSQPFLYNSAIAASFAGDANNDGYSDYFTSNSTYAIYQYEHAGSSIAATQVFSPVPAPAQVMAVGQLM